MEINLFGKRFKAGFGQSPRVLTPEVLPPVSNSELVDLQKKLEDVAKQAEDASVEDFVNSMARAYEKDADGFSYSNNSLNYFSGSIQQDLDVPTLQRLLVSEGWFYIVVNAIASTIAGLPIKLEKKTTKTEAVDPNDPNSAVANKEVWVDASGEPEYKIFERPNPIQTAPEFYTVCLMDLFGTGNLYLYPHIGDPIEGSPFAQGRPVVNGQRVEGLYRINPGLMKPIVSKQGFIEGYGYQSPAGFFKFQVKEIIHIKLPNPIDPFLGLAPIVPVLKNILLDRHSTEHMIRFYRQGARLGGVIKTTQKLSKDQLGRLQRSFDANYTGKLNHHRTLILPQGMEYDIIEQNPGETSLIEFCKFNREPVMSAYRVPPVKVGILDGATYANAMAQLKIFFNDSITPNLAFLEAGLNSSEALLPRARGLRVKFDLSSVEALQQNDKEAADAGKAMLEAGMTVNEVRAKQWKLPPLEGGDKSPALERVNKPDMIPFQLSGKPGEEKDSEGIAAMLADVASPTVTAVMNVVRRVEGGKLAPEKAVEILVTMFGMERNQAHAILGMEPPAAVVEEGTAAVAAPNDAPKVATPQAQPDSATLTAVVPTNCTFEQRVAQLTASAIADGQSVDMAVSWAIERALLEGFLPTPKQPPEPPTPGNGPANSADAPPPAETPMPDTPVEASMPEGYGKVPGGFSAEKAQEFWKSMSAEGVEALMQERKAEVIQFFKELQDLFMRKFQKNLRKHGIHFKVKGNDDVVDPKEFADFLKEQKKRVSKAMKDAMRYGYSKTLSDFNFDLTDAKMTEALEEIAAFNITSVTNTTRDQVRSLLVELGEQDATSGEIAEKLRGFFGEDKTAARVSTIVRTETLTAVSVGQDQKNRDFKKEFPKQAKSLMKIWISSRDDRVRGNPDGKYADSEADHFKLDGEVQPYDKAFSNGLMFPRDPEAEDGKEVINCRCAYLSFLKEDQSDIEDAVGPSPAANAEA